jgi:hypothetical protein
MLNSSTIFRALLAQLLCCCGAISQAAEEACPVPKLDEPVANYQTRLIALKFCLGNVDEDPNPLTKSVAEALKTPPPSVDGVETALRKIRIEAEVRTNNGPHIAMWQAILQEVKASEDKLPKLKGAKKDADFSDEAASLVASSWKAAPDLGLRLGGQKYDLATPPTECLNATPCPSFLSIIEALRVSKLMAWVDAYLEAPQTQRNFAYSNLLLRRWGAYRDKAHSLFWWEVALNGALMDSPVLGNGGQAPCATRDGTSIGFCEVPSRQIVLLHPEAALRYSKTATKVEELKPALTVELIGYYTWKWKSETSSEMVDRRGISMAASYTDALSEKKLGFGPMVHWDGMSIALTKVRGSRWALAVNVPFAGWYFGRSTEAVKQIAKIKDGIDLPLKSD